jgi:hypothetical protein
MRGSRHPATSHQPPATSHQPGKRRVLAAGFDSVGLAFLAVAGLMWAGALYACTVAPVIVDRHHNLNESLSVIISILAAALAGVAVLVIVVAAL